MYSSLPGWRVVKIYTGQAASSQVFEPEQDGLGLSGEDYGDALLIKLPWAVRMHILGGREGIADVVALAARKEADSACELAGIKFGKAGLKVDFGYFITGMGHAAAIEFFHGPSVTIDVLAGRGYGNNRTGKRSHTMLSRHSDPRAHYDELNAVVTGLQDGCREPFQTYPEQLFCAIAAYVNNRFFQPER